MIVALMIGRAGSKGFPGKNTKKILNHALCEYPLIACKSQNLLTKYMFQLIVKKLLKFPRNIMQNL